MKQIKQIQLEQFRPQFQSKKIQKVELSMDQIQNNSHFSQDLDNSQCMTLNFSQFDISSVQNADFFDDFDKNQEWQNLVLVNTFKNKENQNINSVDSQFDLNHENSEILLKSKFFKKEKFDGFQLYDFSLQKKIQENNQKSNTIRQFDTDVISSNQQIDDLIAQKIQQPKTTQDSKKRCNSVQLSQKQQNISQLKNNDKRFEFINQNYDNPRRQKSISSVQKFDYLIENHQKKNNTMVVKVNQLFENSQQYLNTTRENYYSKQFDKQKALNILVVKINQLHENSQQQLNTTKHNYRSKQFDKFNDNSINKIQKYSQKSTFNGQNNKIQKDNTKKDKQNELIPYRQYRQLSRLSFQKIR